jgi:hypothetical protein
VNSIEVWLNAAAAGETAAFNVSANCGIGDRSLSPVHHTARYRRIRRVASSTGPRDRRHRDREEAPGDAVRHGARDGVERRCGTRWRCARGC